jgi:carbohydrate kinase (thermoresistant glucokinase family)
MDDLDPGEANSAGDLAAYLRRLRRCAGEPSYRALEQKTIHASGFLPGTGLARVRLARSTLSDVLNGRKFPRKAFVLTLVEALNVDLKADRRWEHAWDRLALRDQQAGPAAEEVERLRLENGELRQQLARAEHQAGAARARTQDQPGRDLAAVGERAGEGRQDAFDPDVIRLWLDLTPMPKMRSLTELRRAIEPAAAFLAAQRPSADVCRDLILLSRQLQKLGEDGRFSEDTPAGRRIRESYQDVDARFHEALLKGSQNEMFDALKDPVRQALSYRIHREWAGSRGPGAGAGGTTRFPPRPAPLALWLHRGLAAAVGQGYKEPAETFSRAILAEIGTDSLTSAAGIALEDALTLLDPGSVDAVGGSGRERFQHAIQAAVLSSRASAALDGPAVIMGVAGCGKTTIGQLLAGSLRVPYAEADSFHPAGNVAKMREGTALTDQDREPWLAAIAGRIRQDSRVVVSCSALKRAYRDVLRQADPRAWFLYLEADRETAAARVTGRAAHFMPASLVDSQFADLEPLSEEEAGLTVDGTLPPEQILATAIRALAPGTGQS